MQKTAYAHWVNWIIRKAHSRQRSCQSCSWEQSRRAAAPRSYAARCMIAPVLTHAETRFKCTKTFFHYPNLYLDWSHVCVFISSSTLIPPSVCSSRALTSTHSAWHQALWLGAPWPALIHRRGCKWRRSEIDRAKDSPVKVKGKQTFSFPRLQPLALTLLHSTLYEIYMTHQKGHKSLFDCGTIPEKYISRHLFCCWSWETEWKPAHALTHIHLQTAPGLKGKEARK